MSEVSDLALRLQGAMAIIGDRTPTHDEWLKMKDMVDEVVAIQVARRLTEQDEPKQLPQAWPGYFPNGVYGHPTQGTGGALGALTVSTSGTAPTYTPNTSKWQAAAEHQLLAPVRQRDLDLQVLEEFRRISEKTLAQSS